MTKLQFEALKAKYPNRLRCFIMIASPSIFIVFDPVSETRTASYKSKHWPATRIDSHLSEHNNLPVDEGPLSFYTSTKLVESNEWEEL